MPGGVYGASALLVAKLSYYKECKISLNYIVHNVNSGKFYTIYFNISTSVINFYIVNNFNSYPMECNMIFQLIIPLGFFYSAVTVQKIYMYKSLWSARTPGLQVIHLPCISPVG
jgi:hypothetical protein